AGSPTTAGMMFDPERRRGAAGFYRTLADAFGAVPAELEASYRQTVGHELGHTPNLPHAVQEAPPPGGRAASLTFMSYPQRYTGPGPALPGLFLGSSLAARQFWSKFDFRFAREELLELRHGNLFTVAMGGYPYRGEVAEARVPLRLGGTAAGPGRPRPGVPAPGPLCPAGGARPGGGWRRRGGGRGGGGALPRPRPPPGVDSPAPPPAAGGVFSPPPLDITAVPATTTLTPERPAV